MTRPIAVSREVQRQGLQDCRHLGVREQTSVSTCASLLPMARSLGSGFAGFSDCPGPQGCHLQNNKQRCTSTEISDGSEEMVQELILAFGGSLGEGDLHPRKVKDMLACGQPTFFCPLPTQDKT